MKLLLTSAGLENPKVGKAFLKLVGKPASNIKIIFIPTASRTKEELYWVNASIKELESVGVKRTNIQELQINRKITYTEIKDFDVMYMCGGNTFYLLAQIRKFGFDNVIEKFISKGKLYLGVSAGSILMGPDIEISGIENADINDVCLTDFTGLNYINTLITPHYVEKQKKAIANYQKTVKYKIISLTDDQAIIVIDGKQKLIH